MIRLWQHISMIPHRNHPPEQLVLEMIFDRCQEHGYRIHFHDSKSLDDHAVGCSAYVSGKDIHIAARNYYWFEILMHEYAHVCQDLDSWHEDPWDDYYWQTFDGWLLRDLEVPEKPLKECTGVIARCELDAERRVVRMIKKHRLTRISIENYIRQANAYVYSYEATRITRAWPKRNPSEVSDITALMPTRFIRKDRVHCLPRGYLDLYRKHCI